MKSLVGKVALVTGGASGLGYAMAERFLGAGMKVALADIEADALQQASETLTSDPELILPVQLDVTDRLAMDPPMWQIILSVVCLIAGCAFFVWLSARIYRVGILMYGKKVTFKELGKWIFYKG